MKFNSIVSFGGKFNSFQWPTKPSNITYKNEKSYCLYKPLYWEGKLFQTKLNDPKMNTYCPGIYKDPDFRLEAN